MSNPTNEEEKQALAVESKVGHPGDIWETLQQRVQNEAITRFSTIENDWLALMWSIDAFRTAGVPPREMGRQDLSTKKRLEAVYRGKGNWFATILALLLQNQTDQQIQPRTKVQGFSQLHQVDLAWPARQFDPRICVESKVTGAPPYDSTPSRGAISDFSNRRKELKFAATDLKLYRRQQETAIEHWGAWREKAPPMTYFLWAARMRTEGRQPDQIERLIAEAKALVDTYLEGAGIFAWKLNTKRDAYEVTHVPTSSAVTSLDDVLYRIASEIKSQLKESAGRVPPEVKPSATLIDVDVLFDDPD